MAGTVLFFGSLSTKLVAVIEEDCTASLNVAVTLELVITPEALGAGVSLVTVGTGPEAVVKVQVYGLVIGSPAVSLAPLTVAVYFVEFARAALGVKVAVFVELL